MCVLLSADSPFSVLMDFNSWSFYVKFRLFAGADFRSRIYYVFLFYGLVRGLVRVVEVVADGVVRVVLLLRLAHFLVLSHPPWDSNVFWGVGIAT